MTRSPTKSSLTRKLDLTCSQIIRRIGFCRKCKMKDYEKLQCAHIYSRDYKSVRWDLKNLVCLCAKCHFWAHKNPILFTEFIKVYLGEIEYETLKIRALPTSHWKVYQLVELLQTLTKGAE